MALDTRSKRASSVQVLMPYIIASVMPDGTLNQGDRQHIALSYSGILSGNVVTLTTERYIFSFLYRRLSLNYAYDRNIFINDYDRYSFIIK